MFRLLLIIGVLFVAVPGVEARDSHTDRLDNLMKKFEENPSDARNTIQLLRELKTRGQATDSYVQKYFQTQKETDYTKEYNWMIIRDYVEDANAPQIRYVLDNKNKFMQNYSKDDVYQKLDNVFVKHLEQYYEADRVTYKQYLDFLKNTGYEHYEVVSDYFYIKELRAARKSEDYFYKARKLFRYFPENRKMIKEITDGALEIMDDVSRLKVIQLWAGKTVESPKDFDAVYNYALISNKCGFKDTARKYARMASSLASQSGDSGQQERANSLLKQVQ